MVKHCDGDDKFKKLSAQNKNNRMSDPQGLAPSLHTCGPIPMSERKRRLVSYEHIVKYIHSLQYITTYSLYIFFVGKDVGWGTHI